MQYRKETIKAYETKYIVNNFKNNPRPHLATLHSLHYIDPNHAAMHYYRDLKLQT